MASYTVSAGQVGAHAKTLVAATVDTVTFSDDLDLVEVYSTGTADLYFTVDGTTPTSAGANTYRLPSGQATARVVEVPTAGGTVVKLISSATPSYSVQRP